MSDPKNPQDQHTSGREEESESAEKNTTAGNERVKDAADESAEKGLPYETPRPKSVD